MKMLHTLCVSVLLSTGTLLVPATLHATEALPIRNRMQWLENNGYCGETSLQECALYYGTYASQSFIRGIYDPTQQNDLVQNEEWAQVLALLKLKYEPFATEAYPQPQNKTYLSWIKRHLTQKHPVIISTFFQGGESEELDHIMTAVGFIGQNAYVYSDDDVLLFNEHVFNKYTLAQRFSQLCDTREMKGPGATYFYALPKNRDYGIAITGVEDNSRLLCPISLELDRIDEPNLIKGEQPVILKATVTVSGLIPGANYALYRYNDPSKVPTNQYARSTYSSVVRFRATRTTQTLADTIPSQSVAIYRCTFQTK
jgi:hypothetical protein